ncbi:O-acetylhomoserine sulfhydrylase / O-succinylhomoserine sulfhydrylase [Methylocaldum marinum]|uniref:O-acetylhomoserine sulfhydrylase / O-succinylhomoserine sulfhydrylase n=1 Tax=Methylocaldum marinum TaxID=1432792 RepID=A0A250KYQ8_9GAMM|nr:PLP-dependent transferase [Methylocaldum marinum]BBA36770.1 O-acetylhomoserine sulfhydrylase / O-succinylhomoserine sulfhydrylase [Methylocaldum marinum]
MDKIGFASPPKPRTPAQSNDASETIDRLRILSPRRKSTTARSLDELVGEQLAHFGIDPATAFGQALARVSRRLYESYADIDRLWVETAETIQGLDRSDRIAYFNAKKFLSFQLAKLLDNVQHPNRRCYQSLNYSTATIASKGPYSVFDNVTAIFSANPVITRTATYIYACAEWIEDAFRGKEQLLEIYSRLLNPTSVALANHIVDLEAGLHADEYFAWNFNSGMAAIDGVLSHLLGRDDILITSRNLYGGTHQLIHHWFAKSANLEIAVEAFDGYTVADFLQAWERATVEHADRMSAGRRAYVYLESPCNPHGYVLDVPAICSEAHRLGLRVILDATVGTPFLYAPLQRKDPSERPDFVIHSYTKDLSGNGSVIAGVVIGRNEDMFVPKGESMRGVQWNETLFWNVYYVKGAFLNADAAFDVLQGLRTLDVRMLKKCINTQILARFLAAHPNISVHCNALPGDPNREIMKKTLALGLPAPLFTLDMGDLPREAFQRFFDNLSPTFGHMISLGQSNTIVACPALTTHSELDEIALREAGISPTTIRIAVGDEDPLDLILHLVGAARLAIDPVVPDFSRGFGPLSAARDLVRTIYLESHRRYVETKIAESSD